MAKFKTNYKPVQIMNLNAYEIIYKMCLGEKIVKEEKRYKGSAPISLDLLKLFEFCKNKERKDLCPYKFHKSSPLDSTDAIINVSFNTPSTYELLKYEIPESFDKENIKLMRFISYYYLDKKLLELKDYENGLLIDKIKEDNETESIHKDDDINKSILLCANAVMSEIESLLNNVYKKMEEENKEEYDKITVADIIKNKNGKFRKNIINNLKYSLIDLVYEYINNNIGECEEIFYKKEKVLKQLMPRVFLYKNGFDIDAYGKERHYSVYKRSASKSKEGDCVFIENVVYDSKKDIYNDMKKWTWMNLSLEKDKMYDMTSIKAYEALVMSSIIGKTKIKSDEILMLDSIESKDPIDGNWKIFAKFGKKSNEAKLYTKEEYENEFNEIFIHRNILWDGQALVDKSVFENADYPEVTSKEEVSDCKEDGYRSQGMMVLRNKFFKACAFNTNIRKYYDDNKIKSVTDMFGRKLSAKKIKMIVTVDSLKLFKFADVFFNQIINKDRESEDKKYIKLIEDIENVTDLEKKRIIYEYWLDNIETEFGIVKNEHPSHLGHGKYHEVSYQVLNTLPLSKEDMGNLIEADIDYLKKMKSEDDLSVMLRHLRFSSSSARKTYYMYNMLKYAPTYEKSKNFRNFRSKEINKYKEKMAIGDLKIKGDFYYLCSMPMEMLEFSIHKDVNKIKPYLDSDTVYIRGMKEGEKIALFRSPHLSSGSVCLFKTKKCKEYDKYFNLYHSTGSNIVVISPWNSNVMVKLGGCDFDGDEALCVKDETIIKASEKINELKWMSPAIDGAAVSVADEKTLKGDTVLYSNTMEDLACLDYELAKSSVTIGVISNYTQFFNSYLWDGYFNGANEDYLRSLYDYVLQLAVLNELEIDRSKHSITLSPEKISKEILNAEYIKNENGEVYSRQYIKKHGNRILVPNFWYELQKQKGKSTDSIGLRANVYWDTPLDYIEGAIADKFMAVKKNKNDTTKIIDDESIYFEFKKDGEQVNSRKLERVRNIMPFAIRELTEIDKDKELNEDEKNEARNNCLEDFLSKNELKTIEVPEFRRLLKYAFWKYSEDSRDGEHKKGEYVYKEFANPKYKYRYLGILFAMGERIEKEKKIANPVIECIKNGEKQTVPSLEYSPLGNPDNLKDDEIVLWGDVYKKIYDDEKQ